MAGFLGPNGAGKTTTLRMLLGLVAAVVVLAIALPWLPAKGVDPPLAAYGLVLALAGGRLVVSRDLT